MLNEFLEERKDRGCNEKTREWYKLFLAKWIPIREENIAALRRFLDLWPNPQSQDAANRAVSAFERYLAGKNKTWCWLSTVRIKRTPSPRFAVLAPKEFALILRRLDLSTVAGRRDHLAFNILWHTGARRDSIRTLRMTDIDPLGRTLQVTTKNGLRAPIAYPDMLAPELEAWMRENLGRWLFPSPRRADRPVCPAYWSHLFNVLGKQAGISHRVWLHGLRHSAATRLVESGADLATVQQALLHRSVRTTMLYISTSLARVREAINKTANQAAKTAAGVGNHATT